MRPKHHVFAGTLFSIALLPAIGPVPSAGFLAGSVLIDLDHYLDFLIQNRFRHFSIQKMFVYHAHLFVRMKRPDFLVLDLFHTFEFLACMIGLSLWSHSLLFQAIIAGMTTHFLLDLIYLHRLGAFSARAHSFLEYVFRKRALTRQGIDNKRIFREVLDLMEPL